MSETIYTYTKSPVDAERLEHEVIESSITIAIVSVSIVDGNNISIKFKAALSVDEESVLQSIINNHTGLAMEVISNKIELDTQKDSYGKYYFTNSITNPSFYYSPHSLDFYTAKHKSLYNRLDNGAGIDDGTDAGDAHLEFYDASNVELVQGETESDEDYQTRLSSSCVKTIMSWEKQESFDVAGALLHIEKKPVGRAYLWVIAAPDIPYEYGGSKPFMGRGMNLQMMSIYTSHYFDAKTSKTVTPDPVYHSGKVNAVIKHSAGEQIGIQLIYILYEE